MKRKQQKYMINSHWNILENMHVLILHTNLNILEIFIKKIKFF